MKKTKIFFRADFNDKIGLGHLIRSLGLASMLKREFDCIFLIKKIDPKIYNQINEICVDIHQLPETSNYLNEGKFILKKFLNGDEIVVLDGYNFTSDYQQIIKNKGSKLVCIDDIHTSHFVADLVINHSGDIKPEDYSIEPYTKLCLGPEYALLREPFLEKALKKRTIDKVENIFICFGGSDTQNLTCLAIEASIKTDQVKTIHVVLGSGYKYQKHLDGLLESNEGSQKIKLHNNLSAQQMIQIMQKCQLGISSASGIAYEICSIGMGLITGAYIDNQKNLSYFLKQKQCAEVIENYNRITSDELSHIIEQFDIERINTQIRNQKTIFKNSHNVLKNIFKKLDAKLVS